ncbi:MAG: hypothetical protein J5746_13025 [Victivallales bacterium]|nr:hypothetical protein [Victivallales bacterium]
MSFVDLLIVIVPLCFILWLAVYSKRYARNAVDYLAAGRVAGRYVIATGSLISGLSVITLVAGSEQNYQTGFGVSFWANVTTPIMIVMALTGYCTYRWRQTRCLSKGQFIEMRYGSRGFRFVTAVISTVSEMLANAIGPAIATNFFIYYLGLPHRISFLGVSLPCYAIIVVLCLTLATVIIWPAGRISLLVTDSLQALLSYPVFVIIAGFIILKLGWHSDVQPVLLDRVARQSFVNPYDVSQLRDFNLFALIVTLTNAVVNRASWIGNDTTSSGRTPHEQKMAGILGSWRDGFSMVMLMLLALITMVFMNSANFAKPNAKFGTTSNGLRKELSLRTLDQVMDNRVQYEQICQRIDSIPDIVHVQGRDAPLSQESNLDTLYLNEIKQTIPDTPKGRLQFQKCRTLYYQMMMPMVCRRIFPIGMVGLFCLLMIMLLLSTDDSRIFNATGCIVQDMILPFYGSRISPKRHLLLLRLVTVGVAVFFAVVAIFFSQLDFINMFTTIMTALWLGAAGPIMVFGLYTRFGNLVGAWCALIFGSGTAALGMFCQRTWAAYLYPMLERNGWLAPVEHFLVTVSSPFNPWIAWKIDPFKFPINSYEILFMSIAMGILSYIIGSLLTYRPYNLDKLLHRGEYADDISLQHERASFSIVGIIRRLVGITEEYSLGDKVIAWSVFLYSFVYQLGLAFVAVIVCNVFCPWSDIAWSKYFLIKSVIVPSVIGVVTTVWFCIGGIRDLLRLFRDLGRRANDAEDNGQILSRDVDK